MKKKNLLIIFIIIIIVLLVVINYMHENKSDKNYVSNITENQNEILSNSIGEDDDLAESHVNEILKLINNGNYDRLYELLDGDYKEENFSEKADFEEYFKTIFDGKVEIDRYINVSNEGKKYYCEMNLQIIKNGIYELREADLTIILKDNDNFNFYMEVY